MAEVAAMEPAGQKSRFATINEEQLNKILTEKDAKNTKRATDSSIRTFKSYLREKNYDEDFEDLPNEQLDAILKKFYSEVRTENGELYKKSSLTSLRHGINRYLSNQPSGKDRIHGKDFTDRGKSTPVPIFNHRKRPRQAVIADPHDGQGTSKYPDLMPVGGFSGGNKSNTGFQRFSTINERGDNARQNNPPQNLQQKSAGYGLNNSYQNTKNSSSSATVKQACVNYGVNQSGDSSRSINQANYLALPSGNGGFANQINKTNDNLNRGQTNRGYPSSTLILNSQTRSQNNQNKNIGQYGPPKQENTGNQGVGCQNYNRNNQNWQGNQQNLQNDRNKCQQDQQNSNASRYQKQDSQINQQNFIRKQNGQSQYGGYQQRFQPGMRYNQTSNEFNHVGTPSNCGNQGSKRLTNNNMQNVGGIPVDNSPARGATFPGRTQATDASSLQEKKPTKQAVVKKIDPSLHVLTLSVSRVPYWAKYKENINMIFEVYGIIDSAVLRDPTGSYKEFILRDEHFQIKCVFFEIDRVLPKLTRGHWHRCMGTYDVRNGQFKCVSVRAATVEEKNHGQQQAVVTDEMMRQMTRHLPEQ